MIILDNNLHRKTYNYKYYKYKMLFNVILCIYYHFKLISSVIYIIFYFKKKKKKKKKFYYFTSFNNTKTALLEETNLFTEIVNECEFNSF